jgi:NADP-dependent 3-hydroxy acid dehydrogenase YdfG
MKGMFVPENHIWNQIDSLIEKIHLTLPLADQLARALNESRPGFVEAKKQEIQAADLQMHVLDRLEDQTLQQMIAGQKTPDEFNGVRLDVRDARNRLFERIAELRRDVTYSRDETKASVLDLADQIKEFYLTKTIEEKISLIDLIYENLRLRGQQLEFNFKNPFRAFMDTDFNRN